MSLREVSACVRTRAMSILIHAQAGSHEMRSSFFQICTHLCGVFELARAASMLITMFMAVVSSGHQPSRSTLRVCWTHQHSRLVRKRTDLNQQNIVCLSDACSQRARYSAAPWAVKLRHLSVL